ncbi:MAG TPA: FAD binding domain-containing protein [Pyrinomonadaceae bacterium]|nr:FAD binding domain-containing protein [Pyrinomonadaceae bacterium]
MRLPKFDYRVPRTIAEAVKIIADTGPEAQFVAGGTDLYPNMKRRQQTPRTVISVMRLPELNQITGDGGSGVVIGASTILTDICEHPIIKRDYPVIASAARTISTPILRNMGTIGGNLLLDTRCNYYDQNYEWRKGINFCLKKDGDVCWVAPGSSKCWAVQSSDLVPVMVAIGAKFRLVSTLGERMIDAAGFYNDDGIDYLKKRADELLVDIHLPPTNGWRASYQKLRRRGAFDFPVLGVAAYVRYGTAKGYEVSTGSGPESPSGQPAWGGGRDRVLNVEDAKIVLGGIAPSPIDVTEAAQTLIGNPFDDDHIQAAAEACYNKARPLDNTDFVMNWRKQMAREYTLKALRELM